MSIEQTNNLYIEHSKKVGLIYSKAYAMGIRHNKNRETMGRNEYLKFINSLGDAMRAEQGYRDGRLRKRPPVPYAYKDSDHKNINTIENDGMVNLCLKASRDLKNRCQKAAASKGLTMVAWITSALEDAIKEGNEG